MSDFLDGFRHETGLDADEAAEQWSFFCRQLSDADIRRIEAGGYEAGLEQGREFNRLYPPETK